MNSLNEDLAIAGLLHDIGKFGQRAEISLRVSQFSKYRYNYLHASFSAQIMTDYFELDSTLVDYSAMHHNLKETDGRDEYWIVASADRLASGFEREKFENYNANADFESENFKTQRLRNIFDEKEEYKIDVLDVRNIFSKDEKSTHNEYVDLWKKFLNDLEKIDKGNRHTDLATIEYLLKKYTTFIPSSTTFKKDEYSPVKANIPLYDHLKTTALFSGAIEGMNKANRDNVLNYYKKEGSDIEQNDFMLIAGDFFGIQKFIFDKVEAKKASKILRAKSAYIQILTKIVAISLCEKLGMSRLAIISDSAGKFEILAPNKQENKEIIAEFKKELNAHFVKEFYGQTGVGVCYVECGLADFIGTSSRDYQKLRTKLSLEVEKMKFNKFDLLQNENYIFEIEEDLNNQNLCPLCHKRKKEHDKTECETCSTFIKIGTELSKENFFVITKDETATHIFSNYYIKFVENPKVYKNSIAIYDLSNKSEFRGYAKWELSSYIAKDENLQPLTFEVLANNSVQENEHGGVKALMALKADVDGMGDFIKNSTVTDSFAKFNFFSRMVDYYFSVYVPHLMSDEKYQNTYTVFAGGDDLFILGAWDEVIALSKEIRKDFRKFCEDTLSLSAGMIMTKPNKPVNFIAQISESWLEKAKEHKGFNGQLKDAVSLFGETVKWEDYLDDQGLMKELELLSNNTAFLYRLMELVAMSKKVKGGDVEATIWKSKLNYSFYRNMDMEKESNRHFMSNISTMIEKYPEETKMFLSEFIYKRRES